MSESLEMPVQMTTNIATPVGGTSVNRAEAHEAEIVHEETRAFEVEEEVVRAESSETSSDRLFESARDDGFEEALEKFSNGDLDSQENEEKGKEEIEITEEDQVTEEVEVMPEERSAFHEQIVNLEKKVNQLEKDNKQLLERAKNSEMARQIDQEIMLQLALALHELAKKEENEEQKISMFELLVNILAYFLKETLIDSPEEDSEKAGPATKPASKSHSNSEAQSDSVVRLMELLNERRQGSSTSSTHGNQGTTPHVENLAA